MSEERLSKYLSRIGIASRRHAEALIVQGRIRVSDHVAAIGEKIIPGETKVFLDGKEINPDKYKRVYIALNKPPGCLSTCYDPFGRPTVVSLVKEVLERVYPCGRLDLDAQGLLVLTNDGDLAHVLTHPRHLVIKEYVVETRGKPDKEKIQMILSGIMIDGKKVRVDYARFLGNQEHLRIVLGVHEGEKHLVKKIVRAMGYEVRKLTRTRIGPLKLSDLPLGKWRYLTDREVQELVALGREGGEGVSYGRKDSFQDH